MALLDSERKKAFLNDVPCTLMAACMHFTLLSAQTWMTVEGVMMFYLFVRVFDHDIRASLVKIVAFTVGKNATFILCTHKCTHMKQLFMRLL